MSWLRGYASNAAGDSVYVGLNGQVVSLTGLAPNAWSWARTTTNGVTATLPITTTGLQTISVWMREDGIRLDRLLLTTDTTYAPTGFGPTETPRLLANRLIVPLDRTIVYTYDNLYRLTDADYSTGELYEYDYDPVGNRLEQIINGDTTTYTYDDANRLEQASHQSTVVSYQFDDNGNLLKTGVLTNAFDAANRLTSTIHAETTTILPKYNGVGDRVAQTVAETTVYYALDVVGLPEVIQTSEGNSYLHLPGVIVAESAEGEVRYLLSDGLGSIRQAVDETGDIVSSDEYDPYGNPVTQHATRITPYGYTGEWWEQDMGLLHLRARWYLPQTGSFLSQDTFSTMPAYIYASNNPINRVDPSGYVDWNSCVIGTDVATCLLEFNDTLWGISRDILARSGNSNAWDKTNQAVNQHINRVMVPQMQAMNPNLYSPSFGWDCPTCLSDTINLPGSWLKAFLPTPTPPVTPTPSPTPTPLPPRPTPGPVYPPNDCNDYPLGPRVYKAGFVDIILFPDGKPQNLPPSLFGYENYYAAQTATGIGVLLDVVEASSFLIPSAPEISALADLGVAGVGSFFAGETYIGKPHPELPTMAVLGQDVIVASAETAIGTIGKWGVTYAGVQTRNLPVAIASHLGGIGWDSGWSLAQAGYDAGRFFGKVPTVVSAGVYMENYWPPHPRIAFMFYQP